MQYIRSISALLLISTASLHGCSWVDSTGNQGVERQSGAGIVIPITEFESSVRPLQDGLPTPLLENTATRTPLTGIGRDARSWNWDLIDEGHDEACESVGGFDARYAADSLRDACSRQSQCDISIKEVSESEEPGFIIGLPRLKAPVALTYLVSTAREDGTVIERDQIICALSVNEAPSAGNDSYRVVAGNRHTVSAEDSDNLLANDLDDVDVRNQPLRVNTQVVTAPLYADEFSLQANGGFIYTAASDTPLNNNGEQTDTFVYSVGDGLHKINATVTLTIVAANNQPLLIGTLPDAQIDLSLLVNGPEYDIDVSAYFNDTDNDPLYYSTDTDNLPEGLSIQITEGGQLTINIDTNESNQLSGKWLITVLASDGIATASVQFQLTLIDSSLKFNRAPTVTDIANRIVQNGFEYDVSGFFDDPDGDSLRFSSESLPPDVSLSASGILSGRSNRRNSRGWFIVIQATDDFGESVSDGFLLVIN